MRSFAKRFKIRKVTIVELLFILLVGQGALLIHELSHMLAASFFGYAPQFNYWFIMGVVTYTSDYTFVPLSIRMIISVVGVIGVLVWSALLIPQRTTLNKAFVIVVPTEIAYSLSEALRHIVPYNLGLFLPFVVFIYFSRRSAQK